MIKAYSSVPPSRILGEFLGTAFLLIAVVGSGIMAERLTDDAGLQLLQNAVATGCALVALILAFGPISGAHFNPVVTLLALRRGEFDGSTTAVYIGTQLVAAISGVIAANLMFDTSAISWSTNERNAWHLWFAEVIATLGLLLVIACTAKSGKIERVAVAVGAYITGAYYFTSSTSFANPAVTVGRMFSDSFAGIKPAWAPAFVVAQLVGLVIMIAIVDTLLPPDDEPSTDEPSTDEVGA